MLYRFAILTGVFALAIPGCLFHGNYPNGYYGGPSVLPSQPWTGYSNGPVYQPAPPGYQPGGTYPAPTNGGAPYVPTNPGTSPGNFGSPPTYSPTDTNPPSTYQPGGTNSAPPFNPNPGSGGVPQPNDDNSDFNRSGNKGTGITPTSSVTAPDEMSTPFKQQDSRLPRRFANENVAETEAEDAFSTPVIQTSGVGDNNVLQANEPMTTSRVNSKIYSHHPQFNWMQGKIEYDDPSSSWIIMYDENPRPADPYGGELTLADDPFLSRLRSGDVVRIEGMLSTTEQDSRGKPLFHVTKLQKQQ